MSVKDRLKLFISDQKLTISAFEVSILASNGYVNSISKSIGVDKFGILIEKYPNLNITWLLTGKGEMLLTYPENKPGVINNAPCSRCADKDKIISLLEDKVEKQQATIKSLEKSSGAKNPPYSQTA